MEHPSGDGEGRVEHHSEEPRARGFSLERRSKPFVFGNQFAASSVVRCGSKNHGSFVAEVFSVGFLRLALLVDHR